MPIICHVVSWMRERCPSSLAPCHLWQVRELALGSQEWESWPCSILATAYERAGPALLLGSTLEMTLLVELQVSGSCELERRKVAPWPLPHVPSDDMGEENVSSPQIPCYLWQVGEPASRT